MRIVEYVQCIYGLTINFFLYNSTIPGIVSLVSNSILNKYFPTHFYKFSIYTPKHCKQHLYLRPTSNILLRNHMSIKDRVSLTMHVRMLQAITER